jgi:hypothetical protein
MQVERGKTRPNTMMTGHTGYITHARKILKPPTPQITPQAAAENQIMEEQEETLEEEMAEEETT